MKKLIFLILVLGLMPAFLCARELNDKSVARNEPAPNFSLLDLNDNLVTLDDAKGKPVILFFWTTWCPYCRRELTTLNNMYEALLKDDIQLLTINIGESKSKVSSFVQTRNLVFTILLDRDSRVADSFDILGVPTYFLIDKEGRITSQVHYFPTKTYKNLLLQ